MKSFRIFVRIMISLYLARHGETEGNVAKILQGHMPGHLTPEGFSQASELAEQLRDVRFDSIVCSDLQRAIETATCINKFHNLQLELCPLLRERDWGEMTGMSFLKLRQTEFPASVESVEAMFERAEAFINYLLEKHDGETVLAVGHGLFSRCVQAYLGACQIRDIPRMNNAEVRRVEVRAIMSKDQKDESGVSVD